MKTLPVAARIYIGVVVGAAVVLLALFAVAPQPADLPVFFGLTAATILTATFKLRLPTTKNRATMSASFIIDFAALLLFGPHKAMLIAGISAFSQSMLRMTHRDPAHRVVFNVASVMVTVEAAGAVYRLAGGGVAPLIWSRDAKAAV